MCVFLSVWEGLVFSFLVFVIYFIIKTSLALRQYIKAGDVVTKDMENAEALSVIFTTVFTCETYLWKFQVSATSGKVLSKEKLVVEEDRVSEHLNKLDVHKSMGPGGMDP